MSQRGRLTPVDAWVQAHGRASNAWPFSGFALGPLRPLGGARTVRVPRLEFGGEPLPVTGPAASRHPWAHNNRETFRAIDSPPRGRRRAVWPFALLAYIWKRSRASEVSRRTLV
jgi:hypothetical protein